MNAISREPDDGLASPRVKPSIWRRVRLLRAFEFRDFRLLWISSLAASFGMQMQLVARGWLTYDMTDSALALTWVMLAFMAPSVIVSPLGGLLADRIRKKPILVFAQALNAVATLLLAWIVYTDQITFWHFIYFGVFNGTVLALSMPTRSTVTVEIVGRSVLVNATMLSTATFNLSKIAGPPVAGVLIWSIAAGDTTSTAGVGVVFYVITALYVVAVFMTVFLQYQGHPHREERPSAIRDLREVWEYARADRIVIGLVFMGLVPMTFGFAGSMLLPVFNVDAIGGDARSLGMLYTAMGIGALAGSLILAQAKDSRRKGRMMFVAAYCWALSLACFALSFNLWLAMFCLVFTGLFSSVMGALNMSIMQLVVRSDIRGRMMALNWMFHGLMPVGLLPLSWIAETWSIQLALLASAALLAVSMIWLNSKIPEVMKIGRAHDEFHADEPHQRARYPRVKESAKAA